MGTLELRLGEQVLKQGTMPYLKSRFQLVQGGGYLTTLRFLHTNDMRGVAAGGLLGTLMKGKVDIEVPLASVASISKSRHGRNEAVLTITTVQRREYRLLTAFDQWLSAFGDALAEHHGMALVERERGSWFVEGT